MSRVGMAFLSVTLAVAWTQSPSAGQTQVSAKSQAKGIEPDRDDPVLPIGAHAPDFSLPGVHGKVQR